MPDILRKAVPFTRKRTKACLLTLSALALSLVLTGAANDENAERNENVSADIEAIEKFIEAFNRKDIDGIMGFFTEDAIYHNMPTGPVQGTEAVRNLVTMFVTPADKVDWEIVNIAQVGSTVLTERIDRFVINGKDVTLPIMGAFDMKDGKIVAWRDYFDMATWQRQTAE